MRFMKGRPVLVAVLVVFLLLLSLTVVFPGVVPTATILLFPETALSDWGFWRLVKMGAGCRPYVQWLATTPGKPEVRRYAARVVAAIDEDTGIDILLRMAMEDPDRTVVVEAWWALAYKNALVTFPFFIDLLRLDVKELKEIAQNYIRHCTWMLRSDKEEQVPSETEPASVWEHWWKRRQPDLRFEPDLHRFRWRWQPILSCKVLKEEPHALSADRWR